MPARSSGRRRKVFAWKWRFKDGLDGFKGFARLLEDFVASGLRDLVQGLGLGCSGLVDS